MDQDAVSKANKVQYSATWMQLPWSVKDFINGIEDSFCCGMQQTIPSRKDCPILPTQLTNHSAGFGSSCLQATLAI